MSVMSQPTISEPFYNVPVHHAPKKHALSAKSVDADGFSGCLTGVVLEVRLAPLLRQRQEVEQDVPKEHKYSWWGKRTIL